MNRNKSNGNTNGNSNGNGNGNSNSMKNMKGGAAEPVLPLYTQNISAQSFKKDFPNRPPQNARTDRQDIPFNNYAPRSYDTNDGNVADDNPAFLRMINQNIDNIVGLLKKKLGENFADTNINARTIMTNLNQLKEVIDREVNNIISEDDPITVSKNNIGEYVVTPQMEYYRNVVGNSSSNAKEKTIRNNFETINSNNVERFVNTESLKDDNNVVFNRQNIETRLKNCQNLEVLYLIKHEELLTTFAFALNLFDKYKYAVKVILFLLKNLATKTNSSVVRGDGGSGRSGVVEKAYITIPPPLIKNIKKLVEDQQKVQTIITKMKETIVEGRRKFENENATDDEHNARLIQLVNTVQPPVQPSTEINTNLR